MLGGAGGASPWQESSNGLNGGATPLQKASGGLSPSTDATTADAVVVATYVWLLVLSVVRLNLTCCCVHKEATS